MQQILLCLDDEVDEYIIKKSLQLLKMYNLIVKV